MYQVYINVAASQVPNLLALLGNVTPGVGLVRTPGKIVDGNEESTSLLGFSPIVGLGKPYARALGV